MCSGDAIENREPSDGTDERAAEKRNWFAGEGEALQADTLAAALADLDVESGDGAAASGGSEEKGDAKPKEDEMEEAEEDELDEAPDFWTPGGSTGVNANKSSKNAQAMHEDDSDDE